MRDGTRVVMGSQAINRVEQIRFVFVFDVAYINLIYAYIERRMVAIKTSSLRLGQFSAQIKTEMFPLSYYAS